ncbi:antigen 5 like allergen Cul n 1-like [Teleopsis dalmanni]|nr:antigen 5 like allergen Cul n 1-like [Teleopsis dalmanni]XP_037938015.1 antigen 5 like allergen Cul n 1-like [Teleopsis dalmanni]
MPISRNLRNAIVKKHNQLRNQVAGGSISGYRAATRMATVRWNNELAKLAVLNVKQCVMKHDQCRSTNSFKYAGQNLANSAWYGTTKTVRSLAMQHIQMWFDEYKDASMSYINSYSNPTNGKKIGHFTQMVQEKATHLGCGILRQQKGRFSYQFIACNYAYTNVLDQAVYNSGTVASSCTTGRNKNYKNLCSTAESYDVNTLSDA